MPSIGYRSDYPYRSDIEYGGTDVTPPITYTGNYKDLEGVLNQLAGTTHLGTAGAANVWAGTTNLETVGALNVKAGNTAGHFRELGGVCNQLAGTSGMEAVGALNLLAGNTL